MGLALLVTACSHTKVAAHATATTKPHGSHSGTTSTGPTTTSTAPPTTTAPTTAPVSSIGPLTARSQPGGAYSVSLPASWVFTNSSVPSDHQTNTWADPSYSHSSLTVVLSGCEGCVKASLTSSAPAPTNVLPAGATVTQTVAPWQVFYTDTASTAGYTDFGTIEVTHNGSAVTGYVMLDLVLPSNQSAAASAVLTSFTLS